MEPKQPASPYISISPCLLHLSSCIPEGLLSCSPWGMPPKEAKWGPLGRQAEMLKQSDVKQMPHWARGCTGELTWIKVPNRCYRMFVVRETSLLACFEMRVCLALCSVEVLPWLFWAFCRKTWTVNKYIVLTFLRTFWPGCELQVGTDFVLFTSAVLSKFKSIYT
jgi:hypothetical protein